MIFEKIHSLDNLEAAWKHVRAKRARPGIDRVRQKDFGKKLEANLQTLRQEIAEGAYRPLPVMTYKYRKQKDAFRNIGISAVRDRIVQQALVQVLSPHFETRFLPCSYAYRRKKSALTAVKQAGRCIQNGKLWLLNMDVTWISPSAVCCKLMKTNVSNFCVWPMRTSCVSARFVNAWE